ncbi:MAG: DUF402 domain-containing protein [Lachnospiraceae bacterium]|nr:DUF402 domain-containing protein [Lachnospiraceae bacterium]
MSSPILYRRRFIPNEITALKDDLILVQEDDLIITKWLTLRPRIDIARGISAYYIDKGFKVSKIYDKNDQLVYWYCDIIQTKFDSNKNTVLFEDLLIDLIFYRDGSIQIADLDELSLALEQRIISQEEGIYALRALDSLLKIIYRGEFHTLQERVNEAEQNYSSSSI